MDGDTPETLVILGETDEQMSGDFERDHHVIHRHSRRVLVIKTPRSGPPSAEPGVLFATDGDVPEGVLAALTESEQRAIAAWALRKRPKERPGEGLSWDAPGYVPPDKPTGGES